MTYMSVQLGIAGAYISMLPCILLLTEGVTRFILLYLHAVGITGVIYFLFNYDSSRNDEHSMMAGKKEMYGMKHLIFNIDFEPKTLWFNMGLWDASKELSFPEACENLVHAVVSNFNIEPNSTILDVGFGCADSSILLAEKYKANVTGITNEYTQWKVASDRVLKLDIKDKLKVLHGSADDLNSLISDNDMFDYIISVDSAYHFNTRWTFLESAFAHLKQRGMIGLYDLTIDPDFKKNASASQMVKLICGTLNIPLKNIVTAEEYEANMVAIGYKRVQIKQLDRKLIFGGLSAFFKKQYRSAVENGVGISIKNTITLKASAYLFALLAEKPWISPILVEAIKE